MKEEQRKLVGKAVIDVICLQASNSLATALSQHGEYVLTNKGRDEMHEILKRLNSLKRHYKT